MAGTNKRPDDAVNRLTGSAAHEGAHETDPREVGEALEADAAMAEADAVIAEEDRRRERELDQGQDEAPPDPPTEPQENHRTTADLPPADGPTADVPTRDVPTGDVPTADGPTADLPPAGRTPVPEFSDAPTVAMGRASVRQALSEAVDREDPDAAGSYDELLGDLGRDRDMNRDTDLDLDRDGTAQDVAGQIARPPGRSGKRATGLGATLARSVRVAVWALPASAVCLALSGMWGWPTRYAEPAGASPGTWLVVTLGGLILGLIGVLCLTVLVAATPGRAAGIVAVVLVLIGSLLLAPVLGVLGLARPAGTRMEGRIGGEAAAELDARFLDHPLGRWLGFGGLIMLGAGWLAVAVAVLASRLLNRVDGYLVVCAVAIGAAAAYLNWQFLITVAAMVLLAAGLGMSWSAVRLTPDGDRPAEL
jgi:hypothetical protein